MAQKLIITIVSDTESWINKYIPLLENQLIKDNHLVKKIHDVELIAEGDIVFYLSCSQIVSTQILSKNKHNLVVHESSLPAGRGWSPLTWQIVEGKNEIPIVLFEATEKVDSGKIYLKDLLKFKGTELVNELREQQARKSIELCCLFVHNYPEIIARGKEQKGGASYYRRRTPKDSEIDPSKSIQDQFNLLRIVDNERYPAFFDIKGERYYIKISKSKHE
ncbi:MAG: formyltransferase family protein [Saprospiraceae bacterium]